MRWIEGGSFLMGSEDFYPEERPVRRVTVDGFWIDEHPVTAAEFRRFVRETTATSPSPSDRSTPPTTPTPIPSCSCPARSSSAARRARAARRRAELVGRTSRARPGSSPEGPGRRSTGATATRSCTSPTRTPRRSRPGRARSSRPRRSGSTPPAAGSTARRSLGRRALPRGRPMANTWQGEFPWQNLKLDGYEGTSPVGSFPPNGYGLLRHDRQRLGVDDDGVLRVHAQRPCCAPTRPSRGERIPAPGDQGRLAPLRAELLPALPAGGAPERDGRHLDRPHRLPLRRARWLRCMPRCKWSCSPSNTAGSRARSSPS